ncbi:MAG TPA: S41 family peptidase [Candidatus Acidoferrales bacterium]|nr:S41 family peptidase [Candidatus Acidoferrales bacterium]
MSARRIQTVLVCACAILLLPAAGLRAQQRMNSNDMDEARQMLRDARDAVKKNYYDPKYHGVDLDARYQQFDDRIKSSPDLNNGMRMVAAFLSGLKDSHTFFVPPERPYRLDAGFRMELIGNDAFIARVRPGTDAVSKVHPGDQIIGYDTYSVNRTDFHDLSYTFENLMPQPRTQLDLRDPDGNTRREMVDSKMQQGKKTLDFATGADIDEYVRKEENEDQTVRQRYIEMGDIIIWKMPEFDMSEDEVDHMFGIVRKHKSLILDLRGNPGGAVVTLERMVGNVFNHDVKIGDRIGRKSELKPLQAKTVGDKAFAGQIIVLVDSGSASAAELFARVMQLEKRGAVLGDKSSGSVMEARDYGYQQGIDTVIAYGFSVTEADLIMKDGVSLEHVGVVPDQVILPTGRDLATGQDPVLAQAVTMAGGKLDPANAGKMFPYEWLPF